jgi:sodium-dependent dicarboxylate transporter 2/3/5
MQAWNLHPRNALTIKRAIGPAPRRLLLGFVVATAFDALWISNTAAAAMMFPIGMAVIAQLERQEGGRRLDGYGAAIMLAIAYGANVGGIGTKIGRRPTPNVSFAALRGRPSSVHGGRDSLRAALPAAGPAGPWWTGRDALMRPRARCCARRSRRWGTQPAEWVVLAVFAGAGL